MPLTLLLSIFLLVVSVGLIPKTKFLTKQFLDVKKKEANFNIKASEFGQKFGDWLIYINGKDDKSYEGVKLFKTDEQSMPYVWKLLNGTLLGEALMTKINTNK